MNDLNTAPRTSPGARTHAGTGRHPTAGHVPSWPATISGAERAAAVLIRRSENGGRHWYHRGRTELPWV